MSLRAASFAYWLLLDILCGSVARGQQLPPEQQPPPATAEPAHIGTWQQSTLTGDWGGLRNSLSDRGIAFSAFYVGEVFANVSGGIKTGTTYDGLFLPQVDVSLEKLLGWRGASLSVSMVQAHGPSISTGYVGDLMGISSTNAIPPATRLYNLWLQQNLLNDRLSVRAGLMNADAEFMTSTTAAVFVNPGWMGFDLPGGGPAYPVSAPGLRVRMRSGAEGAYAQAAVFSGDPTGHNGSNTETGIPSGTVISFKGGAFLIAELGYATNQDADAKDMALAFRLGGWYHTSKRFADQRYATDGLSLANPASTGIPVEHRGNWGVYGLADAALYRSAGGGGSLRGFARLGTSTGDRNLLTFYLDAGLAYSGPIQSRPADTLGASLGYARIGKNARGLDEDTQLFASDADYPVRSHELIVELTYQAQIAPWLTLQPDVQYVMDPSGRALNANGSVRTNALVLGLRSAVTF